MLTRLLLVCISNCAFLTSAPAADLAGRVVDSRNGPVEGATVIILAAQPREGRSSICPTCHYEVGRHATSGANGDYVLLAVDPALTYRVAAFAEGFRAQITELVDPAIGPSNWSLTGHDLSLAPECRVRGRVVDADGKPVAGTIVDLTGRKTADSHIGGTLARYGIDPYAITNAKGEFMISGPEPAEAYDVKLRPLRHSPKNCPLLTVGDDIEKNVLTVDVGVRVRGRIVKDGQPVPGVGVGMAHTNRSGNIFAGHFETATNAEGRFEFVYLPAKINYYLYTLMESTSNQGALPLEFVPAAEPATTRTYGDLNLGPAHSIAGRIQFTDLTQLPGQFQVSLSREGAWDTQRVTVGIDGLFRFDNVPHDESVTLYVRAPGYRLASSRNRFQELRNATIALHVDSPREGIEIFVEPDPAASR